MSARWLAIAHLLMSFSLIAQQQTGRAAQQTPANAAASSPAKPEALTVNGVMAMVEAGLSDDVIVARLRKEDKAFDLSPEDLIRLKKAKVSDAVLKVMMNPKTAAEPTRPAGPVEQQSQPLESPRQPGAPPAAQDHSASRSSSRFRKMLDFTKKTMQESASTPGQSGPKAIDAAGLRKILPPYDPDKPLSEQFPHVALTVLKAPRMWADTYLTRVGNGTGLFTGCFTLQAVVWSDADHSKVVGPFDWCSPRDVEIKLGPAYLLSTKPAIKERFSGYLTGATRTDGPRPPATLLPTDRETQDLEMKNNTDRAAFDLNMDNATRLTLMFANVRHGMGQALADNGDFRIWIVHIAQ